MFTVRHPSSGIEIDVCRKCKGIWFDPNEENNLRAAVTPPHPKVVEHKTTGSAYFDQQIPVPADKEEKESYHIQFGKPMQHEIVDAMSLGESAAGFLFFPVEVDQPSTSFTPVVNLFAIGAAVLTSIIAFKHPEMLQRFAFSNTKPFWQMIQSMFTCFLVHAGWWHLIGNMYFLYEVGDNVEEDLGSGKYFWLIAMATFGGCLGFLLAAGGQPVSAIGASGGVFGVLVYYTLRSPHRRFVMRLPTVSLSSAIRGHYIVIPSMMLIVLYIMKEMIGFALQMAGFHSNIGHIAHLVGGLVGLVFYMAWGKQDV
jgi:membrane associated rhomboid family serine protease/Zn-finger nucleic acid-binding protein